MEVRYTVFLKQPDEGFLACGFPGLPSCASQVQTEVEALENVQDAIREYLFVVEELAQRAGEKWEVVVQR